MPRVSETQIQRYTDALALRDLNYTYDRIARRLRLTSPQAARNLVNHGLRRAGRSNEIQTREVRIQHNNRTTTVTAPVLVGFTTLNSMTFGIELEVVELTERGAAVAMRDGGYQCNEAGYDHSVMPTWKVVRDSSVSGYNGSCEVVSPVLTGNDGLTEIRTVAGILRTAGAKVNKTCGMHIHIGVDNALTVEQQARVIVMHQMWQPAFDALLTEQRIYDRDPDYPTRHHYAKKRTRRQAFALAADWADAGDRHARRRVASNDDRYHAINVNAFYKYGTFEIRSHQGSTNGKNASAWIALNTGFMQWAASFNNGLSCCPVEEGEYTHNQREMNDNAMKVVKAARIQVLKELTAHLLAGDFITQEVHDYLCSRAGRAGQGTN